MSRKSSHNPKNWFNLLLFKINLWIYVIYQFSGILKQFLSYFIIDLSGNFVCFLPFYSIFPILSRVNKLKVSFLFQFPLANFCPWYIKEGVESKRRRFYHVMTYVMRCFRHLTFCRRSPFFHTYFTTEVTKKGASKVYE